MHGRMLGEQQLFCGPAWLLVAGHLPQKKKKYLTGFVGAKEKAIKNMQGGIRCGMEEK